jgi:hypothetical protein
LSVSPSAQQATAALVIADKVAAIESRLRYLIFTQKIIVRKHVDPNDLPAAFAVLDEFMLKRKTNSFWQKMVNQYKENKPQEAELKQEIVTYRNQLKALRPEPFYVEVSR